MSTHRGLARQLLAFGPHAGAHRVALRAGVSVLVPLLAVWWLGRLDWSIYATFGAFTSLYGRNRAHLARARLQTTLAVLLTGCVVLGAWVSTSEHRVWLAVPVAAVVAGLGSLASDAQDWHPPGPLFMIFAFTAVASIPSEPGDLLPAFVVTGASASLSVAIGAAGSLWRAWRRPELLVRTAWRRPRYADVARRHLVRSAGAVLLAGAIATMAGIGHPYWAMVSAAVPLAVRDFTPQLVRGVHRIVGTGVGLLLAALLLGADLSAPATILAVVLLQMGAELLVGRNYAVALVAITPLALLMVHLAAPAPMGVLLVDRGLETVIGVVIGIAVGWATRARTTA